MAYKHGMMGEFDSTQEDWESCVKRVNLYFVANDIDDTAKKLLTVCGPKTYHVIRDLVAPKSPSAVEFDEIIAVVKEHFNPTPQETVQRFKFSSRSREKGETVAGRDSSRERR